MPRIAFDVMGTGPFPVDMLRYDECFPSGPDDAAAIIGEKRRKVRLVTQRYTGPTAGRWDSFNWPIVWTDL
jgi:hypothetical protein